MVSVLSSRVKSSKNVSVTWFYFRWAAYKCKLLLITWITKRGSQCRWDHSAKSFSAAFVFWSFATSFYTPNLSWSVTVAVCVISRKTCKYRSGQAYARNTDVDEYRRDQKVCAKPDFSTRSLAGLFATVVLVLHSSVRGVHWEALSRQSATGAYFAGWLCLRCRTESRFRIFCPSKLSPLQPLRRRPHCAAACTKIDAGNRTAHAAKWKETAS